MNETLAALLNLNDPSQLIRNDILRIGSTLFIFLFELAAFFWVLFDRVSPSSADSEPSVSLDSTGDPPPESLSRSRKWFSRFNLVLALVLLTTLVVSFPILFANGYHGWLIPAAFILGLACYSRFSEVQFKFRPPEKPTFNEAWGLAGLIAVSAFLILLRWNEAPMAINGDVALMCMNGKSIWQNRWHPLYMNNATLPALYDTFYGLGVMLCGPFFGSRLYPLFCGILCPPILYRWVRLFSSRETAWFAAFILLISPFFQYYSRGPMGSSLILMQLLFLYGITRCLIGNGAGGTLVGGIALGLAQWDYYAARVLIGVALATPLIALPFWKSLARGWWWRLGLLILIGLAFLYSFPLMADFEWREWTFYFTPKFFSVENSDVARNPAILWDKVLGHLRMWFDDKGNEARFMTIPGTPVFWTPLAGLVLVGAGFLLFSIFSPVFYLLLSMFVLGVACSLVSMGLPNGHRAMAANLPVIIAASLGARVLWSGQKDGVFLKWSRRMVVTLLLGWGAYVSLFYFHIDVWQDRRVIRCQEYDENRRALRIRERVADYDVYITPYEKDLDRLFSGRSGFEVFHYGAWLPPNWKQRQHSVQATLSVNSLSGLLESIFPPTHWTREFDPAGSPCGWEYITGSEPLGFPQFAQMWSEEGAAHGTLMFPQSGVAEISCEGCLLEMESPVPSEPQENRGKFKVLRGLNRLAIKPSRPDQNPPQYLSITFQSENGQVEKHAINPGLLYSIPLCGWLKSVEQFDRKREHSLAPATYAVTPAIYTHHMKEEPLDSPAPVVITTYRAIASLPEGTHLFVIDLNDSRTVSVRIGEGKNLFEGQDPARLYNFFLRSEEANNKVIEITKIDDRGVAAISLDRLLEDGRREVPPYAWFEPVQLEP